MQMNVKRLNSPKHRVACLMHANLKAKSITVPLLTDEFFTWVIDRRSITGL